MSSNRLRTLASRPLHDLSAPFLAQGVLSAADVHTVHLLAAGHDDDPQTLLGLCFAVRAPRLGHVGVDLRRVPATVLGEQGRIEAQSQRPQEGLPWPVDLEAWHAATQRHALVSQPGAATPTPFVAHGALIMTQRQWSYQARLAAAIRARSEGSLAPIAGHPLDEVRLGSDLAALFPPQADGTLDRQRLAALTAALLPMTVISGGPGTGKTYTIRKVLLLLHRQWQALHGRAPAVALAAPTGKAALRMADAMREGLDADPAVLEPERAWLRALQPTTLHRLLGFDPRNSTRFRHDAHRPLSAEIVVVDEGSMVDLALMTKLFAATAPESRLVLLGDRNQLASVQAGSVLADLTAVVADRGMRLTPAWASTLGRWNDRASMTALVDVDAPTLARHIVSFDRPRRFRQDSGVGQVSLAIVQNRLDDAVAWLTGQAGSRALPFGDLHHIAHSRSADAKTTLSPLAVRAMAQGFEPYLSLLRQGPGANQTEMEHHIAVLLAFDGARVLTVHREGPFGVSGLNLAIQEALLGRREGGRGEALRSAAREDWLGRPLLITETRYDIGRMNGDIGIIVQVQGKPMAAFLDGSGQSLSYLDLARLPPHQTAFALTVHKAQGAQFAHTALVLPAHDSDLLTRELIYTAVTRAVSSLTLIGDAAVLRRGLERRVARASNLAAMLT